MMHPEEQIPARSQTSMVYRIIRRKIIAGEFRPGKRMKIADLAAEYEVRTGAIREALSRLVPEKLVVSQDQKGFAVAPLLRSDLEDLTDLRCEIEAIALRRSVRFATPEWEGALLASLHGLKAEPRIDNTELRNLNPGWSGKHQSFHVALASGCRNENLLDLYVSLFERAERYRNFSVRHENSGRCPNQEHQELLDLALARDAEGLVARSVEHLSLTTRLLMEGGEFHDA